MSTRTDIFAGTIYPSFNGTYGLVTARCRVDLAAIVAEFGAILTGDVFKLFTLPKGFKPVDAALTVITPETGSTTLTAKMGATTYGVTTARDLKAAAATTYESTPASPAMLAADTEVTVEIAFTGTAPVLAEFEVAVFGYWLTALPGEV